MDTGLVRGVRNDARHRLRSLGVLLGVACFGAALIGPGAAGAASFSNPTPITISEQFGPATPSPSTIQVSGLDPAQDVNASLLGFSHGFPSDVDVLLQGPAGQRLLLMADAPRDTPACDAPVTGLTLNFDDSAPGLVPATTALASGTYQPTNFPQNDSDCYLSTETDPATTATALSAFNGTNPNGTWSLFVSDDAESVGGSISGGWKLDIAAPLDNDFDLGKVKKNKNKGTALITVDVPGPGQLSLGGAGVKAQRTGGATISKAVTEAGKVTLKVKAKGAKKAKLQDKGKVKVRAKITYTPTGGTASTETKPIKLIDN